MFLCWLVCVCHSIRGARALNHGGHCGAFVCGGHYGAFVCMCSCVFVAEPSCALAFEQDEAWLLLWSLLLLSMGIRQRALES